MASQDPSPEPCFVARRMMEIRIEKKLSRQQLAELLDLTYLQVYRIETGAKDVSAELAGKFATVVDVPIASLYPEAKAS